MEYSSCFGYVGAGFHRQANRLELLQDRLVIIEQDGCLDAASFFIPSSKDTFCEATIPTHPSFVDKPIVRTAKYFGRDGR